MNSAAGGGVEVVDVSDEVPSPMWDLFVSTYPKVETKMISVTDALKFSVQWAWLPLVIYLGIRVSEPKPPLLQVLSPF